MFNYGQVEPCIIDVDAVRSHIFAAFGVQDIFSDIQYQMQLDYLAPHCIYSAWVEHIDHKLIWQRIKLICVSGQLYVVLIIKSGIEERRDMYQKAGKANW